jgi:hypothetical protein
MEVPRSARSSSPNLLKERALAQVNGRRAVWSTRVAPGKDARSSRVMPQSNATPPWMLF